MNDENDENKLVETIYEDDTISAWIDDDGLCYLNLRSRGITIHYTNDDFNELLSSLKIMLWKIELEGYLRYKKSSASQNDLLGSEEEF